MKMFKISVAAILLASASLSLQSCIGSFSLTNSVLDWNRNVGKKFINEIVFVAFWILPVYEVTGIADLLILNSIEFWSGKNPMEASVQTVDTDHGRYIVACDGQGYTVTEEATGIATRLEFDEETQTWSVMKEGKSYPFMSMIDDNHVMMITPGGDFREVEVSEQGVHAYQQMAPAYELASR